MKKEEKKKLAIINFERGLPLSSSSSKLRSREHQVINSSSGLHAKDKQRFFFGGLHCYIVKRDQYDHSD